MLEIFPPKKKNILIFDDHRSNDLKKVLPKNSFSILFTRYEKINIFILLKLIFNLKYKYRDYLKTYIEYVKPKILITLIDNNIFFYQIKFKFLKKIAVQNGKRSNIPQDMFFNLQKKKIDLFTDYLFTHNSSISKLYAKYIKSRTIVAGSIRSNSIKINKKKIYNIGYISTYRDINPETQFYKNYFYQDSINSELKLLNHLKRYCKENNCKLSIIGSPQNIEESKKEKKFYFNIFGDNFLYFENNVNRKTYSLIDKFKVMCGIDSTLLYESFGRGNKTVFFSYRKMTYPFNSRKFGWPAKLKPNDKFWTSNQDYKSFKKVLDFTIKCKNSQWKKYYNKYYDRIMVFDNKNEKLAATIKKLLKEN